MDHGGYLLARKVGILPLGCGAMAAVLGVLLVGGHTRYQPTRYDRAARAWNAEDSATDQ